MHYDHTQKGVLHWALLVPSAFLLYGAGYAFQDGDPIAWLLLGAAFATGALAPCFAHLRVRDAGDALEIAFGPLALFRRRVPYAEIVTAQEGRSRLIDGWGIHFVPRRGWTWNIHGFAAVELELTRGRRLRVGTDDGAGLVAHLHSRAGLRESRTTT
jgi:hypothetical protein